MQPDTPPPSSTTPPGKTGSTLQRFVVSWVRYAATRPRKVLLITLAITAVTGVFSYKLLKRVRTDFASLLPESDRSVQDLKELGKRYGGERNLLVVVICHVEKSETCWDDSKRLVQDVAKRLEALQPDLIRQVEYRNEEERQFFSRHKYLFMNLDDLEETRDRLDTKLRYERVKKSPLAIKSLLVDPGFDLDDIEGKYTGKEKR